MNNIIEHIIDTMRKIHAKIESLDTTTLELVILMITGLIAVGIICHIGAHK